MLQTFAGGRLFGSRTGHGTPSVVALHGWGRSHRDFDATLQPKHESPDRVLDALALDLPGFGASPPPAEVWGAAEYAECVVRAVEELDGPVVVVGHSFGGRVAVHLAASHPDHVRGLVVTGAPLLRVTARRRPPPAYRLLRGLNRAGVVSDRRMEAARERHGSADFRAARGIMRQVLSRAVAESDEGSLDAVRCPVTLVWGDDDATVPLAVAEAARARLQAGAAGTAGAMCELTVCPGAGHLLPLTAPDALRQAIERHLG